MRKFVTATALAATAVIAVAGLSGCGKVAEVATEQAVEAAVGSNADVDLENGTVTVTDENGGSVAIGEGTDLPANWPAEIPAFDGGTLVMASVDADGAATGMWSTASTGAESVAAYGQALTSAGFTNTSESTLGDLIGGEYTGKGYSVSVVAADADGEHTLMVTATKQ